MRVTSTATALTLALLCAFESSAIVIRDDVNDALYVVDDADFPALVDLFEPGDCIGTLVHREFLLTVAHCAVDLTAGQTLTVSGVPHTVAEVISHPEFDDENFDIALVRFTAPVTHVEPMLVYRGADELGATVTLVGRGTTATGLVGEAGGATDGLLRQATNVVSAANDHYLEVRFESPDEDATALEGVGAAGDSGCPVFLEEGGVRFIAGLNSYGEEVGNAGVAEYGSLDYQTRVSRYLEWIESHVELPILIDTEPPEPPVVIDEEPTPPAEEEEEPIVDAEEEAPAPVDDDLKQPEPDPEPAVQSAPPPEPVALRQGCNSAGGDAPLFLALLLLAGLTTRRPRPNGHHPNPTR
jgi:MYXO-CTERM domain-containing protein